MTTIENCKLIQLPRVIDRRGSLTSIYSEEHVPFKIRRIYYLYDVPGGACRGGHAHIELQQLLVSVMGAFDVVLKDGKNKKRVRLDRAYKGLYIPKMIWRELENFSSGGICLVLASELYNKSDYIYSYEEFKKKRKKINEYCI